MLSLLKGKVLFLEMLSFKSLLIKITAFTNTARPQTVYLQTCSDTGQSASNCRQRNSELETESIPTNISKDVLLQNGC